MRFFRKTFWMLILLFAGICFVSAEEEIEEVDSAEMDEGAAEGENNEEIVTYFDSLFGKWIHDEETGKIEYSRKISILGLEVIIKPLFFGISDDQVISPYYGSYPVEFEIHNLTDLPRKLRIDIGSGVEWRREIKPDMLGPDLWQMSHSVEVGRKGVVKTTVYFPVELGREHFLGDDYNSAMGIMKDGAGTSVFMQDLDTGKSEEMCYGREEYSWWYYDFNRRGIGEYIAEKNEEDEMQSTSDGRYINIGITKDFLALDESKLRRELHGMPYLFYCLSWSELPANEILYLPLRAVVFEHNDFEVLDREKQQALMVWVATGGTLFLNHFDATKASRDTGAFGMGGVVPLAVDTSSEKELMDFYKEAGTLLHPHGFLSDFELVPDENYHDLKQEVIVGLGVFAVVAGVGHWLLLLGAFRGRRFYGFIPCVSVLSVAGFVVYMVNLAGIGGQGERICRVTLVPGEGCAWVAQSQMSQTGVVWKTDFPLDTEKTLFACDVYLPELYLAWWEHDSKTPLVIEYHRFPESDGTWRVPLRAAIRDGIAEHCFSSCTLQSQRLARRVPMQGEVMLEGVDEKGNLVVKNTLPFDLRQFLYIDEKGKGWGHACLEKGKPTRLYPLPVNEILRGQGISPIQTSTFTAEGEATPNIPLPTLPSIRWKDKVFYQGSLRKKAVENISPSVP